MLKKNISILVTGGAGYIGSHIVEHLLKKKLQIIVLDNLKTGSKKLLHKKTIFIKGNINDQKLLKKIFDKYNISTVIHLAGLIDVIESHKYKKKYYKNNVLGTLNLLRSIKASSVKNFIFSSSAGVYGNIDKSAKETMRTKPINNYASMKLKSENLIKKYSKNYNFNYAILRYFNVAGASPSGKIGILNKRNKSFFKVLAKQSLKKKPIINIFGKDYKTYDGTCIRDFIHVTDLAIIHLKSLESLILKKKSFVINCGYGRGYSVLKIAKLFKRYINKSTNIKFKPPRIGDIAISYSDTSNLKKKISWKPRYNNIRKILISAIKWEKKITRLNI